MGHTLEEIIDAAVAAALDRHMVRVHEKLDLLVRAQPPRMLTVRQAADAMGVHVSTIRRMVGAGQLAYKRIGQNGRGVRIDAAGISGAEDAAPEQRRPSGRAGR